MKSNNLRVSFAAALISLSAVGTVAAADNTSYITSLYSFQGGASGYYPNTPLTLSSADGYFYGTTKLGGTGHGTVFKISPIGALSTLWSFTGGADGDQPYAGLVRASDGNFYGTTDQGGANKVGAIFKITPAGVVTTLYSFGTVNSRGVLTFDNGAYPVSALIQGSDGALYGTTSKGGTSSDGTIFKITLDGNFTLLHSFVLTEGTNPRSLVQGKDGNFYGSAASGGSGSIYGTVFEISSVGTFNVLHSFAGQDGGGPGVLVQGSDGTLYGTTASGGTSGQGTLFKISTSGTLTTLYSFTGLTDGGTPSIGVYLASDGVLYGTTESGGGGTCTGGCGTLYRSTTAGVLTTVQAFQGTDGQGPDLLINGGDGYLYGTTGNGGSPACTYDTAAGCGTIFKSNVISNGGSGGGTSSSATLSSSGGSFSWVTLGGLALLGFGRRRKR